jgi:hypothetical protein
MLLFCRPATFGVTTAEFAGTKTIANGKKPLAFKKNTDIRNAHGFASAIPQRR